jgi:undecaprenyl diphosphate synthase
MEPGIRSLRHLALIPDGIRRWAKFHNVDLWEAYSKGAQHIYEFVDWCFLEFGIKYVTIFGMSMDNFQKRGERWRSNIFHLLGSLVEQLLSDQKIHSNKIHFRIIGNRHYLPRDVAQVVNQLEKSTESYNNHFLTLAFIYSGRQEIVEAVQHIVEDALTGNLSPSIDEALIEKYLLTSSLPDVGLIIRTGEHRISNFILWRLAYSEMYFAKKYFLDFTKDDLRQIIDDFTRTERRFGK